MNRGNNHIDQLKEQATLLQEKINRLQSALILEDNPSRKFNIEKEVESLQAKLQQVKAQIEEERSRTSTQPKREEGGSVLHAYHRFTCDRVTQYDRFRKEFREAAGRKVFYYYIYGEEPHSHFGLFQRLAYDLEGRLQDYLNPTLALSCTALKEDITFDVSEDVDIYKENIIKSLFARFSIPVNEQEPLLDKTARDLLASSPRLQGLCAGDYVCIFLSISEWDWDPRITPAVVRWLIESFWEVEFPATAPTFLIFFGVMYEEDNQEMEQQVLEAVEQGQYIRALPRLDMVEKRDVQQWLAKYRQLAPSSRRRREILQKHFPPEETFFMEDLELIFQRLIDEYNRKHR